MIKKFIDLLKRRRKGEEIRILKGFEGLECELLLFLRIIFFVLAANALWTISNRKMRLRKAWSGQKNHLFVKHFVTIKMLIPQAVKRFL